MSDKISKLMNDFRVIGTKYNLDKISDDTCYKELSKTLSQLMIEIDAEKDNIDDYKIKKNKIKDKIIKLVFILYENDLKNNTPEIKSESTPKEKFNSNSVKIDSIIKAILDKLNKN